jgi:lipopolysaccharide heptosyltransferase II
MEEIKKILVVRNDRIGDLILSLPALSSLRKGHPEAHIAILVQPYSQDILYNNPDLDEIILDEGQGILPLASKIKKKRFDVAVILYPSWRNGWVCALSGIPIRVGTGFKPVGLLFNQRVYIHRKECHEVDYCLKLAEKAGGTGKEKEIRLWIKEEERLYAKEMLKDLDESPIIGIHPGSLGSALNWPESHFSRLIELLRGKNVVITGSKDEEVLIKRILGKLGANPLNLCGKTSLSQLIGLFSFYDLFIGPSTGPMHIASGLGKPVIALFSPIPSQSPVKWGPLGERNVVLMPEVECHQKRCSSGCKLYNCMERITPERVLEGVYSILHK